MTKVAYCHEDSLKGTVLQGMGPRQRSAIMASVHVKNLVDQFLSEVAEARVTEFLSAAARSDAAKMKQVLWGTLGSLQQPGSCSVIITAGFVVAVNICYHRYHKSRVSA